MSVSTQDRRLSLDDLLTDLLNAQLITQDAAQALSAQGLGADVHPLEHIAHQSLPDPR